MSYQYTFLGEPYAGDASAARALSRAICAGLTPRYPGIRFNKVWITPTPDFRMARRDEVGPDESVDLVEVTFSVSGTGEALVRHHFADTSWLAGLDEGRSLKDPNTPGFGRAYVVKRTSQGYRLTLAEYEDGLDRLLPLFMPGLLERFMRKESQP